MKEEELASYIKKYEDKYMPLHSTESVAAYPLEEERRKDYLSHFILRLAFSRSYLMRAKLIGWRARNGF